MTDIVKEMSDFVEQLLGVELDEKERTEIDYHAIFIAKHRWIPKLVAALERAEWETIDPDPYPVFGRCPACSATTREFVGFFESGHGRWQGKHLPDCTTAAALAWAREICPARDKGDQGE